MTPYCPRCRRAHGHEPEFEGGCAECLGIPDPWATARASAASRKLYDPDFVDLTPYRHLCPPEHPHLSGRLRRLFGYFQAGGCTQDEFDADVAGFVDSQPQPQGDWVGVLKQRLDLTLLVKKVVDLGLDPQWGRRFLSVMEDADGNSFVWYSGTNTWVREGEWEQMKATVKAHEVYKGRKQTTLTRCMQPKSKEPG
jgi:hypothetical protein